MGRMADLRALLYEPWGEGEFSPTTHSGPLATRLPQCVPQGLEWYTDDGCKCWTLSTAFMKPHKILDAQAELLFIGQVTDESSACWTRRNGGHYEARVCGFGVIHEHYGEGGSRAAALTAALHRLADEAEEKQS